MGLLTVLPDRLCASALNEFSQLACQPTSRFLFPDMSILVLSMSHDSWMDDGWKPKRVLWTWPRS